MGTQKHTIEILDSTLREGEQMQNLSYSANEKFTLSRILLSEVNVDRIEIASALVGGHEKQSIKEIADWAKTAGFLDRLEVLGFVDFNKSVDWVCDCGIKTMNLLVKGSINHLQVQLGKTLEQHLSDIEKTVEYATKNGVKINIYLEDFTNGIKTNPEYVYNLIENLNNLNINHIMLSDTLGIWEPFETYTILKSIVEKYPFTHFDFHAHNDYGLATANALSAIKAGIKSIHVTVNGLGERAGNCSLDEVAVALKDFYNFNCNIDEQSLYKVARFVETFSGQRLSPHKPIYGKNVFIQTAGVHADGDKKGDLYKNKITPNRFGQSGQYALGKLSGKANLDLNLQMLGISLSKERKDILLKKIIELSEKKENVYVDDLPYLVSDIFEHQENMPFKLINLVINTTYLLKPFAAIKCSYNGVEKEAYCYGDGGYDAFMNALKQVLYEYGIAIPHLIDYTVTIPPGGKTDALVQANIVWEYTDKNENTRRISTRGINCDQILAAVEATIKMINMKK